MRQGFLATVLRLGHVVRPYFLSVVNEQQEWGVFFGQSGKTKWLPPLLFSSFFAKELPAIYKQGGVVKWLYNLLLDSYRK